MSQNITISVRSILVSALAVAALLVAYLIGAAGDGGAGTSAVAANADEPATPSMVMTGTGEATAVPDQMAFSVTVAQTRTDLDTAMAATNASMKKVYATLTNQGVAKSDVQTTGLSMHPVYEYPEHSAPVIVGYRVQQKAEVLVKELSSGGKTVSAVVSAGGNGVRVGHLQLQVGDPEAVLAQARQAAVRSATRKAEEYAEATGQSLGTVISLKEVVPQTVENPYAYRAAEDSLSAGSIPAMKVRPGEDQLSVTVQLVWEFA
jgi:uncharacterized protein YggE